MQRREALGVLGATAILPWRTPMVPRTEAAAAPAQAGRALSAAQLAFVTALADTIIPRTDTPGAVEVGAPAFVDLLLADWYSAEDRQHLLSGLDALDRSAAAAQGKPFAELDQAGREAFLSTIDIQTGPTPAITTPAGTYVRVKGHIVTGYVSSKPIAELLRTVPIIPNRFDGCIPVEG